MLVVNWKAYVEISMYMPIDNNYDINSCISSLVIGGFLIGLGRIPLISDQNKLAWSLMLMGWARLLALVIHDFGALPVS